MGSEADAHVHDSITVQLKGPSGTEHDSCTTHKGVDGWLILGICNHGLDAHIQPAQLRTVATGARSNSTMRKLETRIGIGKIIALNAKPAAR
jgi:hypothetical protein